MNLLVAIVLLLLGLASADLAQAQDPPQAWPPFAMDACSSTDLGPSAANSGWPGLFRRAEITCSGLYEGITQVTVSCTIDPSGPSVQDNSRFVATCLQRSAGLGDQSYACVAYVPQDGVSEWRCMTLRFGRVDRVWTWYEPIRR